MLRMSRDSGSILRSLQTLFSVGTVGGMTDGQLLEQFLSRRDEEAEAAFAALVASHGPMVWDVCRGILADSHAAEDAFQATFLVLVRRAGSIRRRDAVGPWLHGVARRVAVRARAAAARRRRREVQEQEMTATSRPRPDPDLSRREQIEALHEEVDRLAEKYRAPLVLCYLEGRTHAEAARLLRCPVGTVSVRLSRARDLLRARLTRRGVALPAAVAGAMLGPAGTRVGDAPGLADSTIRAAMHLAAGKAMTAGTVPASVAQLAGRGDEDHDLHEMDLGRGGAPGGGVCHGGRRPVRLGPAARPARTDPAPAAAAPPRTRRSGATRWPRDRSLENLKYIGLAMHNFAERHDAAFPAAAIRKDGKPLLSWRVAILPYLDQEALYEKFHLDEPWDSPHNKALLEQMPDIYAPGRRKDRSEHSTYYQVFAGPGALFGGDEGTKLADVKDGMAMTLMVVEAARPVPWTKPEDLPFDESKPLAGAGRPVRGRVLRRLRRRLGPLHQPEGRPRDPQGPDHHRRPRAGHGRPVLGRFRSDGGQGSRSIPALPLRGRARDAHACRPLGNVPGTDIGSRQATETAARGPSRLVLYAIGHGLLGPDASSPRSSSRPFECAPAARWIARTGCSPSTSPILLCYGARRAPCGTTGPRFSAAASQPLGQAHQGTRADDGVVQLVGPAEGVGPVAGLGLEIGDRWRRRLPANRSSSIRSAVSRAARIVSRLGLDRGDFRGRPGVHDARPAAGSPGRRRCRRRGPGLPRSSRVPPHPAPGSPRSPCGRSPAPPLAGPPCPGRRRSLRQRVCPDRLQGDLARGPEGVVPGTRLGLEARDLAQGIAPVRLPGQPPGPVQPGRDVADPRWATARSRSAACLVGLGLGQLLHEHPRPQERLPCPRGVALALQGPGECPSRRSRTNLRSTPGSGSAGPRSTPRSAMRRPDHPDRPGTARSSSGQARAASGPRSDPPPAGALDVSRRPEME